MPPPAATLAEPTALPRADNALRGILCLISATMLFSVSDITSKYVSQTLPVIEVAWVRYSIFVLLTLAPAARHGVASLHSRRPALQLARGGQHQTCARCAQRMTQCDGATIRINPLIVRTQIQLF